MLTVLFAAVLTALTSATVPSAAAARAARPVPPVTWRVDATHSDAIQTASIFTDSERRDTHLRSPDFFAADSFPTITFASTRVERSGSDLRVTGNLTIRGVTRTVTLTGTYNGVQEMGQMGGARIGFEFHTRISRLDYGVRWNRVVEAGGVMLGDDVDIDITVEAIAQN